MPISLNANVMYSVLTNTIISVEAFADPIKGKTLVDMFRVDGGMLGDQKWYVSTDALHSKEFTNAGASNLLTPHYNENVREQVITLDRFRQIAVTTDEYQSKQAWMEDGAFSKFNTIMVSWLSQSKKVIDDTRFKAYVGTTVSNIGNQVKTITVGAEPTDSSYAESEAYSRHVAQSITTALADLFVDIEDYSRAYNDYGFLRAYDPSDLIIIWNAEYANEIRYLDLPTIFHQDSATPVKFDQYKMPARFFGELSDATSSVAGARALNEMEIGGKEYYAGDVVDTGSAVSAKSTYTVDPTILCKICSKKSVPVMSGFSTSTAFFNPEKLRTTNYLTWGENTLDYIKEFPFITVKVNKA